MSDIIKIMLFFLVMSFILLVFLIKSGYGAGYSILVSLIVYVVVTAISVSVVCTAQRDNIYIPDNIDEIQIEDYLSDNKKQDDEIFTVEIKDVEGNILRSEEVSCSFLESLGISCDTLYRIEENILE